jgi:flagellar secretion chaperone FliS
MNAATTYKQMAVTTQNPGQIIVMLYDGAIRFLKQARIHIQSLDYPGKYAALIRAQDIVFELNASLDMEQGGEISKRLRSIYTFVWANVNRVNTKNDIELLDRLIVILEDLAGAWRKISA